MPEDVQSTQPPTLKTDAPSDGTYTHRSAHENLEVSKYQLLTAVGDLLAKEREHAVMSPRAEWLIAAIATFVSTSVTLATADFHQSMLIPASVWQAITVIFATVSLTAIPVLVIKFLIENARFRRYRAMDKYQWLDALITQIDEDKKRVFTLGQPGT